MNPSDDSLPWTPDIAASGAARQGHNAQTQGAAGARGDVHRFSGRVAFQEQVRQALELANTEGWNELWLSDASFEDWPLGERAVHEALQAWSRNGRKLHLLAKRFETVQRLHHRFVSWRVQWAHIVEARAIPSLDALDFPSAMASSAWALQRLDLERSTGFVSRRPGSRLTLHETLREHWGRASPAFAASTLGL
jgi:hypothetical protein